MIATDELHVPHISYYCLTVEKKTALEHFIKTGKMHSPDEKQAEEQFKILIKTLKQKGYTHYEISNFCKEDFYSKHNTNYWKNENYLGIGPSAHSYNGKSRQWNVANNNLYIQKINNQTPHYEIEELTEKNRYNEYILTGLRTIWGCNATHITNTFGTAFKDFFVTQAQKHIQHGFILKTNDSYTLTEKGLLFADKIASDLFFV